LELYGIESHEPYIEQVKDSGITVFRNNMEYDAIPVDEGYFHIVVANQVIEHIKEIFWVFGEISRVLKKGGSAIIGVPNLAALHNRVALLFGEQPTSVELLSEHVRGITIPSFRRFITCEGYFEVMGIRGSNFYPMPPSISRVLSRAFPSLSVSIFFHLKRTEKPGNFVDILGGRIVETPYFRGKSNSLPG
jgi:SAM-dependent methyltransferase